MKYARLGFDFWMKMVAIGRDKQRSFLKTRHFQGIQSASETSPPEIQRQLLAAKIARSSAYHE